MPTYDYVCGACGHELELFQSMSESPKRKCPSCGRLKLKRRIGAGGGLLFRGSGFYQTDYRSRSYTEGAKKDKPEAASGEKAGAEPKAADGGGKKKKKKKKAE